MAITIPTPSLNALSGKKTYILVIISIATIWLDYFYQIGASDVCKAQLVVNAAATCAITLSQAIYGTLGALAVALKSNKDNKIKSAIDSLLNGASPPPETKLS